MKDIYSEIEYNGKKYRLVFDFNVMEDIQSEYGSIDAWGKLTAIENGEPNLKALKFGFAKMLNEGIEISNEETGEKEKPFTLKQTGRIISEIGLATAAAALNEAVVASTKSIEKNA